MHTPELRITMSRATDSQGLIYTEVGGKNVAVCYDAKDAPLIAAAPKLLDVLERLTDVVVRINAFQHAGVKTSADDWSELYQLQNEARAAIAEARE